VQEENKKTDETPTFSKEQIDEIIKQNQQLKTDLEKANENQQKMFTLFLNGNGKAFKDNSSNNFNNDDDDDDDKKEIEKENEELIKKFNSTRHI